MLHVNNDGKEAFFAPLELHYLSIVEEILNIHRATKHHNNSKLLNGYLVNNSSL